MNKGEFISRSQAIGCIVTKYVNKKKLIESKNSYFDAYKHGYPANKQQIHDIDRDMIVTEEDHGL